jgi:hypothetical protein
MGVATLTGRLGRRLSSREPVRWKAAKAAFHDLLITLGDKRTMRARPVRLVASSGGPIGLVQAQEQK